VTVEAAQALTVEGAVAALRARLAREVPSERLEGLTPREIAGFLTPAERRVLGEGYLSFRVNVPTVVSLFVEARLTRCGEPFWLFERGFQRTPYRARAYDQLFEVWRRPFGAGRVGLGVHALRVGFEHYFVALAPARPGEVLEVEDPQPPVHRLGRVEVGAHVYVDRTVTLQSVSPELLGQTLLLTQSDRRPVGAVYLYYRATRHPATPRPDQVVLTPGDDPKTSQTVGWRTSTQVPTGAVKLWRADRPEGSARVVPAETRPLESPRTVNDPRVHRHTALMEGLDPATPYRYRVGDGRTWTAPATFTTAPPSPRPFKFLYFGDAQNGLEAFGAILRRAHRLHPDAAFAVLAGDLVDRGNARDDWDAFFHHTAGVFGSLPLVPAIGNHEAQDHEPPRLYRAQFRLPHSGPRDLPPGHAYRFEYGGARFVVLDSTLRASTQAAWLEAQLREGGARWKLVVCHHPPFPSRPGRYYAGVREVWAPLFERHGVALVLGGHDHAYLRTHPMDGAQPSERGTVYVVANAGGKFYPWAAQPYAAASWPNLRTYQVIEVDPHGPLRYCAYDTDDRLVDAFTLTGPRG